MSTSNSIIKKGHLDEIHQFLTSQGMSQSEIDEIVPKDNINESVAKNCYIESESCKPAGHGNYDSGRRTRVVCEDQNGKLYEGRWSGCVSDNTGH
ncbi:MAG: hypothetical protein ISR69_08985 [Gammaproteobacteria bacterium]|nr:hypothetical protein [Gammaproteobacteria bacterium]